MRQRFVVAGERECGDLVNRSSAGSATVVRQTRGCKRRVWWSLYAWGSAQSSKISRF